MTTRELVTRLQWLDPSGNKEVKIEAVAGELYAFEIDDVAEDIVGDNYLVIIPNPES